MVLKIPARAEKDLQNVFCDQVTLKQQGAQAMPGVS